MTRLELIAKSAIRSRARLAFTIGSIVIAFVLLGLLLPIGRLFETRVDFANANRLIVMNKASIMRPLPVSYGERLSALPNVSLVSHFTFFGAMYRSEANPVAAIVTDASKFSQMVEEVKFNDSAAYKSWLADPSGIAVGRALANRLKWKVGDLVPVYSTIYAKRDGSYAWTFKVAAIFDAAGSNGTTDSMVIDYRYFDQERASGNNTVGWYAVRIDDSAKAADTAKSIDSVFQNSADETSATTERAFAQSFLAQVGDFQLMITIALVLVFWTLVLITANTMSQSIRERFLEFAVMKTVGFSRSGVIRLIFGESLLLVGVGGVAGLAIAAIAVPIVAAQTDHLLSLLTVRPSDWAIGLLLVLLISVVAAIVPALRVGRQPIIDGLAEAQ